jgi:hypothetical protein
MTLIITPPGQGGLYVSNLARGDYYPDVFKLDITVERREPMGLQQGM